MKRLIAVAALAAAALAAAPARAGPPRLSAVSAASALGDDLSFSLAQAATEAEVRKTFLGLPRNVGTADRIVRGVLAAALIGVGAYGLSSDDGPNDTLSYVLLGVSAIPGATAATGYCPLYQALGIDTN
jgi:hypothetical protein